jgi:undecaprenyl-diphosphatase
VRTHTLERLAAWEHGLCKRFNRVSDFAFPRVVFIVASQLGNGAFWYALMAALLIWGNGPALRAVVHMVAVGIVCTLLYKVLKRGTSRLRPYVAQPGITLCAVPLDRYSFPSGHTLHATAFTLVALDYYPGLFWLVVPFSVLVALSRIVLGLHYPSDVLAGAAIGTAVTALSFWLPF